MISRMNLVQDAARLAMADHRAAAVRQIRREGSRGGFWHVVRMAVRRLLGCRPS